MNKLKQSNPLCQYNNQTYIVCFNPDCKANPFICNCQQKCQCQNKHLQCDKIDWHYIKNKLNSSIVKNNSQFQPFLNTVEQLYQSVIMKITKAYDDYKQWKDHFGLTKKESQFLKLAEEGRYSEMTGKSIYDIRKQIKTPSKVILKTKNEIQQEVQMINTYAQSILLQFSDLYSKNIVEKINITEDNDNKRQNLDVSDSNKQLKINQAHKLLGLNQKGNKFLIMLNEGIFQSKLQNMQITMKTVDLGSEKLKQQFIQFRNEIKIENQQLRNEIKTENLKSEIQKLNKYQQIYNEGIIIQSKLNNIKSQVKSNIELTIALGKKQLLFLLSSQYKQIINGASYLNKIEQKVPSILKNHIQNNLPVEKLREQFIKIQRQAEIIRQQYDIMNKKNFDMIKIKTISSLFFKKIAKINLIYRASQNNFQASKFHDKCDGKQHTITIVKTQFGDVIGGYTPLPWDKKKNGNYQKDSSQQSFIFSLTNKHILKLIKGKQGNAIYQSNHGPRFGGGSDLLIYDKANQNNCSYANPGDTYIYNSNEHTPGNQQWNNKSNGSIGGSFRIQEWQVYTIVFQT